MKGVLLCPGFLCAAALLVFAVAGCGFFGGQEKAYQGCFWPAEVNLSKDADLSDKELAMAVEFCSVDRQLEGLLRELRSRERQPDKQWMENLAREFPWLNGIFCATIDGQVIERYPENPIKQLDSAGLLDGISRDGRDGLRYRVQENALGAELAVLNPLYTGLTKQGYLVAHFDVRSLVRSALKPDRLILLNTEKVLWPGELAESSQLAALNWSEILEDRVSDTVEINGKRFFWLARFVGRDPLIYVLEISRES